MPGAGSGSCGSMCASSPASERGDRERLDPVVVGWHHVPRRPLGRRLGDRLLVGRHVVVVTLAHLEVGGAELPPFLRVLEPLPEARALLLARDVEEDLHDRRALLDQHALPLADLPRPLLHDFLGREPEDVDRDDVLVVRAVEDADLPPLRRHGVHAPEVVVRKLGCRRRAERVHLDPLRVHAGEDAADDAVLASAVEPLEHEQQAALALGVESLLEQLDLALELLGALVALLLVEAEPVSRVAVREVRVVARLDEEVVSHARDAIRGTPAAPACPRGAGRRARAPARGGAPRTAAQRRPCLPRHPRAAPPARRSGRARSRAGRPRRPCSARRRRAGA